MTVGLGHSAQRASYLCVRQLRDVIMLIAAGSISGHVTLDTFKTGVNIRRGSSSTSSPSSSFDLNNVYQQRHRCSHPESGKIR